ncbi:toxic anion resistance protein [Gluconobacter oxydans]|uniref:toxic anion resistance protein n=1 Tax=Gluconobacter oxydans TaxID=442 RepID=UPI0034646C0D
MSADETRPLDLSDLYADEPAPAPVKAEAPVATGAVPVALEPMPAFPRLVEISRLPADMVEEAHRRAGTIDFGDLNTLLSHGMGALGELAKVSDRMLAGRTLGESDAVGEIAAGVLDGVKILRIGELQKLARGEGGAPGGFLAKMGGLLGGAKDALNGFAENRKKFNALMDQQEAKARVTIADLKRNITSFEDMYQALRQGVRELNIDIAAGQLALEDGERKVEALRQHAMETQDPVDAAEVMELRGRLANFSGHLSEQREGLMRAALTIPMIKSTREAAEARIMALHSALTKTIPNLKAACAVAVGQVDNRNAATARDALNEADRKILGLVADGALDAARTTASSRGVDPGQMEALAQAADKVTQALGEMAQNDRLAAERAQEQEKELHELRDRLATSMRSLAQQSVQPLGQP